MSSVPTSTPTMPAGNRFGRHFFYGAAAGGLIVAAVATGLWARDNGGSSTSPHVETLPAPAPDVNPLPRGTESTTYFVNSEAEALEMQGTIADANAIRSALGEPPLTIVVVGSESAPSTMTGRRANAAEGYDFGTIVPETATTPDVTSSLELGEDPSAIANFGDGRTLSTTSDVGSVSGTLALGEDPSAIANFGDGRVVLATPDAASVTVAVSLGEDPAAIANLGGWPADQGSLSLGEDEMAVAGFRGK